MEPDLDAEGGPEQEEFDLAPGFLDVPGLIAELRNELAGQRLERTDERSAAIGGLLAQLASTPDGQKGTCFGVLFGFLFSFSWAPPCLLASPPSCQGHPPYRAHTPWGRARPMCLTWCFCFLFCLHSIAKSLAGSCKLPGTQPAWGRSRRARAQRQAR